MKERLVGAGWVQDQVTHKKPCFCSRKEVQQPNGRAAVDNGAIIAPRPYLSAAAGRQRIHTHLLSSPYCVRLVLVCYTSGMLPVQRPGSSSQERAYPRWDEGRVSGVCVEELGGHGNQQGSFRGQDKEKEGRVGAFLQSQCPLSSSPGACPESPVLNHWPQGEGSPL